MKELPIDLDDLAGCMQVDPEMEIEHYLDTRTGEIHCLNMFELEAGDEEDLPDWEKPLLPVYRAIEAGDERYVPVPHIETHEAYDLMVRFAERVQDSATAARLADALDGRGAFSRFRRVLRDNPELENQWHRFEDEAVREEVRAWLASLGIQAVEQKKDDVQERGDRPPNNVEVHFDQC